MPGGQVFAVRTGHLLTGLLASLVALGMGGAVAAESSEPAGLTEKLLTEHNAERGRVGVPPLEWSGKLAADAQGWAERLARQGELHHAPKAARAGAGENLWMGSAGYYSAEAMIGGFIGEKQLFKDGVFPAVSTTGNWQDVGHYTQLVWRDTRQVGCAVAKGAQYDVLVCRYFPAGNYEGHTPY